MDCASNKRECFPGIAKGHATARAASCCLLPPSASSNDGACVYVCVCDDGACACVSVCVYTPPTLARACDFVRE